MKSEEIVDKILSLCPKVSRKEVLDRLKHEKRRTGGLISDDALLRVIAAEFGCEIGSGKVVDGVVLLGDLVPHLGDVTVVGRAVAVFPVKVFGDGGKLASLLVVDGSGILRVVLWNEKAGLVESGQVKVGDVVRFGHGYTREFRGGGVELHVGERGMVEVNPEGVDVKSFPSIERFATHVGDLKKVPKGRRVHLAGLVRAVGSVSSFDRDDSSVGRVLRFVLGDYGEEVSIVVWDDKVDAVDDELDVGGRVRVVNGKVKRGRDGGLEVHVDGLSFVEVVDDGTMFVRLADLREGLMHVGVEGEVVGKPVLREVQTAKGELVKVASFGLRDDGGRVWVSAWRELADVVAGFNVGDRVVLKDVFVRRGFGDQLELSTRSGSVIVKKA